MNSGFQWFICCILAKVLQVTEKSLAFIFYPLVDWSLVLSYDRYDIGLYRVILYAVTPIMVLKQIISLIHLYTAALDMAAIDEAERADKAKRT